MMSPKMTNSNIVQSLNFPTKGEILNNKQIIDASYEFPEPQIFKYKIILDKGTKRKDIPSILKKFHSTQLVNLEDGQRVVRYHDYNVRPKNGKVEVIGAMHIIPLAESNPKVKGLTPLEEFDQDYNGMFLDNPESYFRIYKYKGFNGPQFRAKLWSFVGYMGENYGYCDDERIYHRRASLVMPKIKITKAPKGAKMMYHTHPRKDEPSLSSPDDFLLYFDLSYEPHSIRNFFTVMSDRIDHFYMTPKKGSKNNFVKLDEDKFIGEVDAKMDEIQEELETKYPPNESYRKDLEYCEQVTKKTVQWLNKKYSKYMSIKYKCYYKVRKNPHKEDITNLHLDDEFISRALHDINNRNYKWPNFKSERLPHENYVYWHSQYYFRVKINPHLKQLEFDPEDLEKLQVYLDKEANSSGFSYYDVLNILNITHDINLQTAPLTDGEHLQSRLPEIMEFLNVPTKLAEDITLLDELMRGDPLSEHSATMAGDYQGILLLSNFSLGAVTAMKEIKKGNVDTQYADYDKLKYDTKQHLSLFLSKAQKVKSNPPPVLTNLSFKGAFPEHVFDDNERIKADLEEFSVEKYNLLGKNKQPKKYVGGRGESALNLYIPVNDTAATMTIQTSTFSFKLEMPAKDSPLPEDPIESSMLAYSMVVEHLNKLGYELPIEDLTSIEPMRNPAPKLILVSGPSGSGKSTTVRYLLNKLPNSKTIPSYTTRKLRKSDRPEERIVVTKKEFLKMKANGEFLDMTVSKDGTMYGRKKVDFANAEYIVIELSLSGFDKLKKQFPNAFGVYLEPVEDPKEIEARMLRRGGITPQQAKGRAKIIPFHIKSSKKLPFDLRVKTANGQFKKAAKEVLEAIPKKNPIPAIDLAADAGWQLRHSAEDAELTETEWQKNLKDAGVKNPPWPVSSEELEPDDWRYVQKKPYIMLTEPWSKEQVPIDERLAPLIQYLWNNGVKTWYSDQGLDKQSAADKKKASVAGYYQDKLQMGYLVIREPYAYVYDRLKGHTGEHPTGFIFMKKLKGMVAHMPGPEPLLDITWLGQKDLQKIYKAFDLTYPTSRKQALKQVKSMLVGKKNPTDGTYYWTKEDEEYHAAHHAEGHQIHENPPLRVVSSFSSEDGIGRFYNAETGKELTGRIFDGATIDTAKSLKIDVGEEMTQDEIKKKYGPRFFNRTFRKKAGVQYLLNIAKWGDKGAIQVGRSSFGPFRYFESATIKGPVFLFSDPTQFHEPTAFLLSKGQDSIEGFDKTEAANRFGLKVGLSGRLKGYLKIPSGQLTDFQGNAKSHRALDYMAKSITIEPGAKPHKVYPKANPPKHPLEDLMVKINPKVKPSIKTIIASIDKKNVLGKGAFGIAFRIPNTKYVFKINERVNEKYFKKLDKYLDGEGKKPEYPEDLKQLYKIDWGFKPILGQPLYAVGGKGPWYHMISEYIPGYEIYSVRPYQSNIGISVFGEKIDKKKQKAVFQKRLVKYPIKNMKKMYAHQKALAEMPQSEWNRLVGEINFLTSKNFQHDINDRNFKFDPDKQRLYAFDWFWEETVSDAPNRSPPLMQIYERSTHLMSKLGMEQYFHSMKQEGKFEKERKFFITHEKKSYAHRETILKKLIAAFNKHNLRPAKSDITASVASPFILEGDQYPDLALRVFCQPRKSIRKDSSIKSGPRDLPLTMANPKDFDDILGNPMKRIHWMFCDDCNKWYQENAAKLPRNLPVVVKYENVERMTVKDRGYLAGLARYYNAISSGGKMRFVPVSYDGITPTAQAHNLSFPYIFLQITNEVFRAKGIEAWAYSNTNGVLRPLNRAHQIRFRINSHKMLVGVDDVEHMFFCLCHELSAHTIPHHPPHYDKGFKSHCPDENCINSWVASADTPPSSLIKQRLYQQYLTLSNPPKLTVRIEESTKPEKKLMAVFTKPNGRTKTTHFGARGMSDYTQHKDPKRMENYLARHGGMGEDWNDPTSAGALSRWILWGKPSLRESFNDYKKKFKIEGVMAVTNTKMNPGWRHGTQAKDDPFEEMFE